MSNRVYNNVVLVVIALFSVIFILSTFMEGNEGSVQGPARTIIFYALPVLSLALLCFSIYAYVCKVTTVRRLFSPAILIIIASIATLWSFGSVTADYLSLRDLVTTHYSTDELGKAKESCLDLGVKCNRRAAVIYYIQTGKSIEYLDEHGCKTVFSPDEFHIKAFRQRKFIQETALWYKKALIALLVYAAASCACFLLLLWKYARKTKGNEKNGVSP